ncbi:MAG: TVP38/TMEM64 family protein [Clostridia bacterium]|nr:TVP38/TMEM64 family protein [Clostridia bacterium]
MNQKTKATIMAFLRVAVAMTIFALAVINYEKLKNIDVRALVDASTNMIIAIITIWGVYLVKSVLFIIPAMLIYVSIGMAFPTPTACLISLVGIILEITVTYLLGVFLGGPYVNRLLSKTKPGKKILDMKLNENFPTLLVIRALPVFPIDFVSLFWGASRCRFPRYFIASLLGIMPRVVLFTIVGDGIYEIFPMHRIVELIIIAIPVGCIIYLIKHFVRQKRQKQE